MFFIIFTLIITLITLLNAAQLDSFLMFSALDKNLRKSHCIALGIVQLPAADAVLQYTVCDKVITDDAEQ